MVLNARWNHTEWWGKIMSKFISNDSSLGFHRPKENDHPNSFPLFNESFSAPKRMRPNSSGALTTHHNKCLFPKASKCHFTFSPNFKIQSIQFSHETFKKYTQAQLKWTLTFKVKCPFAGIYHNKQRHWIRHWQLKRYRSNWA